MQASGQNCFQTAFAKLFVNGEYFGLYLRVENMDADFLKNTLLGENGNLYKATKDGACMSIFDDIENDWEKKSGITENCDDLKKLISDVNFVSDSLYLDFIKSNFNYSQFVNMLALNIYLANASTYYHNYYVYHYPNGKWEILPWDMDKTLSYYEWMPY
jgi:spore coat protein CotH